MTAISFAPAAKRLENFISQLPIEAKKSLGQNFLVADHVIEKIISAVQLKKPKYLIEIGPGPGALTDILRTQYPNFMVIEFDRILAEHWKSQGLNVAHADALRWDWRQVEHPQETVLASNLPYQISSSLVIDRSLDEKPLQGMVLMFQKEVAQRIRALPQTEHFGMLSVVAQTFWKIETVCEAGPRDFNPAPKVASRVLSFSPRTDYQNIDRKKYFKFIKSCFAQRRKLLRKNLDSGGMSESQKALWSEWIVTRKWSETIRAEEVSVDQFVELFLFLKKSEPQG